MSIRPRAKIHNGAIVDARAVAKGEVNPYSIVDGVPAKSSANVLS